MTNISLEVGSIEVDDGRQSRKTPAIIAVEQKTIYLGQSHYRVKAKELTGVECTPEKIILQAVQKNEKKLTVTIHQVAAPMVMAEKQWEKLREKLESLFQKYHAGSSRKNAAPVARRRTFGKTSSRTVRRFQQAPMDWDDDDDNKLKQEEAEIDDTKEPKTVEPEVDHAVQDEDSDNDGLSDVDMNDDSSPIPAPVVKSTKHRIRKKISSKLQQNLHSDDDDVEFENHEPTRKTIDDDDEDSGDEIPFPSNNVTTPATQTVVSPSTSRTKQSSATSDFFKPRKSPKSFDPSVVARTPPRVPSAKTPNAHRMVRATTGSKKFHASSASWLKSSPMRGVSPMARRQQQLFGTVRKRNPEDDDPIEEYPAETTVHRPRKFQRPRLTSGVKLAFTNRNDISDDLPKPHQFRGLQNLGNTCYMNSSLQMLATCPDLMDKLKSHKGALTQSLCQVATGLKEFDQLPIAPRNVKKAIDDKTDKFSGYEQRDAHEFLNDIVDYMHEELEQEAKEQGQDLKETVFPTDDFCLTVNVCLGCTACGYTRNKVEMYRHLSIDIVSEEGADERSIKASVERGLESFFQPETREIKCEKCDHGTHAHQTLSILNRYVWFFTIPFLRFHSPEHLLLHLKRFIFVEKITEIEVPQGTENQSPNRPTQPQVQVEYVLKKNRAPVTIPQNLSLTAFRAIKDKLSQDSVESADWSQDYELRSVVHHIGVRASSGHYTADAIRKDEKNQEVWVAFDDTTSERTSLQKISSSLFKQETAYILLYSLQNSGKVGGG